MVTQANSSVAELLASLPAADREEALRGLSREQEAALLYDWRGFWARPNQLRPGTPRAADQTQDWRIWLLLAGRGFGKTRTGGETVREWVAEGARRIHLVGPTTSDVRNVMVMGESGILNWFPPHQRPMYEPSKHMITFHTGAVAETFSADEPERLRGPQCSHFWADELAAWRFLRDSWDNLMFGWRIGDPHGFISTTPRPVEVLKEIIASPHTVTTRASSYENRANLAPAFFDSIISKYEGTRLGRQELLAELLEDVPGALWTQKLIDDNRIKLEHVRWDALLRIVVAIDPAVSNNPDSSETGIVVAALTNTQHVLVIDDLSCKESPLGWAAVAVNAYRWRRADRIVGEVNNGGDLVEGNIRAVSPDVAFRAVRASRGKAVRAEPVAALYEQQRVHHVGHFPELEQQMTGWSPQSDAKSPDRMDALVWAVTELVVDPEPMTQQHQIIEPVRISAY